MSLKGGGSIQDKGTWKWMSEVAGGDPKQGCHSLESNSDQLEEDNQQLVSQISPGSISSTLEISRDQAGSSDT